jgi:hypothetical protein
MSLFGEKCVRCGERTRGIYRDKPTCETCRDQIEVAMADAVEAKRPCPADGATLAKDIAHGVIIDRCPNCGGVWLDAGEMERINRDVAEEVWRAVAFARPVA